MKARTISILILTWVVFLTAKANPTFRIVDGIPDGSTKTAIEQNVNDLITFINRNADSKKKKLDMNAIPFASPRVKETLEHMWLSSMMKFPDADIAVSCLKVVTGGFQVRGIPLDILNADKDEERQELTIDFSNGGQINNVAIAIEMHRYDAIMSKKTSDLDYARKQAIVNFVEDFRTAYNKKDIDLIENVFSSNALIITGRIVTRATSKDLARNKMNNYVDVEYDVLNKKQYIDKLKRIFKNNKFINVKFSDVTVVKLPGKEDIYGVYLKQDWHTSRYSDEGLLYLKVDFRDKDFPMIQVRVWKPFRDANGNIIIANPKEDFSSFMMDYDI